jgi:hypothetical protein
MITFETHIQEINRQHLLAQAAANDAIEHAKAAGVLFLEIKSRLKHGQFLHWIRGNVKVSLRQAQRYMAVAQGTTIPLRRLIEKSDTVSHLSDVSDRGTWKNRQWQPNRGYVYVFNEDGADYWVTPSNHKPMGFLICKHYAGERISSEGFFLHYTVLAEEKYEHIPTENYIGTKCPIHIASGVEEILRSYGLKDLQTTMVHSSSCLEGYERPHAEPHIDCWYWDEGTADYDLFIKYLTPLMSTHKVEFS